MGISNFANNILQNIYCPQNTNWSNSQYNGTIGLFKLAEPTPFLNLASIDGILTPPKERLLIEFLPKEFLQNIIVQSLTLASLNNSQTEDDYYLEYCLISNNSIDLSQYFELLPIIQGAQLWAKISKVNNVITSSYQLKCTATFKGNDGKLDFLLNADLGANIFELNLISAGPLNVISEKFGWPSLGSGIIIDSLCLAINTSDKTYTVGFELTDKLPIQLPGHQESLSLTLDSVSLFREKGIDFSSFQINAKTTWNFLNKFEIEVDLAHFTNTTNGQEQRETILSGTFDPGKIFQLKDLTDVSALPTEMQDIGLENLTVSYSSINGFAFSGIVSDLLTIEGNEFSVQFAVGPNFKSLGGIWNNTNNKGFVTSHLPLGSLSHWIKPQSAMVDFSMGKSGSLFDMQITNSLDLGISMAPLPTLLLELSRSGGNQISGSNLNLSACLVLGNIQFTIDADKTKDDTSLFASLSKSAGPQKLRSFLTQVGPFFGQTRVSPVIPDLAFNDLDLQYDKASGLFQMSVDTGHLNFNLGRNTYQIQTQIKITHTKPNPPQKGGFDGTITGQVNLGNYQFDLNVSLGTVSLLQFNWVAKDNQTIGVLDFLLQSAGISNKGIPLPDELNVQLTQISLIADLSADKILLTALTVSGTEVFVIAGKTNGEWGFIAGVCSTKNRALSSLPKVGKYLGALGNIQINNEFLIFSTDTYIGFDLASLQLPTLPGGNGQMGANGPNNIRANPSRFTFGRLAQVGPNYFNLYPGVAIGFTLNLNSIPNSPLSKFGRISNKSSLFFMVEIADPISRSYLEASLGASFSLRFGNKQLKLKNPTLKLGFNLNLELSGTFDVPTSNKDSITISPMIAISETEMDFSMNINGDNGSSFRGQPFGLKGLRMDQLGVEFALFFDPPSFGLGLTGQFHIINQAASSDDFGIVISLDGDIPNIDYFSAYLSQLSIPELITAFTGDYNPNIPSVLTQIQANDVSLYFCDNLVTLPDGTQAYPGFGFNGNIQVFGFDAHASLNVLSTGTLNGSAEFSPINWSNVLSLTGTGQGVSITEEDVNGNWIPARASSPKNPNKYTTRKQQVVPPGGAHAEFNAGGPDFFSMDFKVSLFGFIKEQLSIALNDKGFNFSFSSTIGDGLFHSNLDCSISSDGFSANGGAGIGLKAQIPSFTLLFIKVPGFKLDCQLSASFSISISKTSFSLGISGSFEFDGHSLNLPSLNINVSFSSLKELVDNIVNQILNNLNEIFKEVFSEITGFLNKGIQDIKHLADQLGNDVKKLGGDIDNLANNVEHSVANFATHAWDDVEEGVKNFGNEVWHGLEDFGETVANDLSKGWDDAKDFAEKVIDPSAYHREQKEKEKINSDIAIYYVMNYTSQSNSAITSGINAATQMIGSMKNNLNAGITQLENLKQELLSNQINSNSMVEAMAQQLQQNQDALESQITSNANNALENSSLAFVTAIQTCMVNQYGNYYMGNDNFKQYVIANFDYLFGQLYQLQLSNQSNTSLFNFLYTINDNYLRAIGAIK